LQTQTSNAGMPALFFFRNHLKMETHRLNLKRKLDIDGQAELIKFAVENRRK
jgi:DNA-binding CsgD family transcriptional regulator